MSNSINNFRQHLQAAYGAVHLPSGVIRNDDAFAPNLVCLQGIFGALNTFDDERSTTRNTLPLPDSNLQC